VRYPLPPDLRLGDRLKVLRAVRRGRAVEDPSLGEATIQFAVHVQSHQLGSDRWWARVWRISTIVTSVALAIATALNSAIGHHATAGALGVPAVLVAMLALAGANQRRRVVMAQRAEAATRRQAGLDSM
jgi:hypothetical protein